MKKILSIAFAILSIASTKAQWVQTDTCTPTGTYFRDIAVNSPNIFEGDENGDVFFSNNNGFTWTKVINGLTGASIYALATKGSITFAGTCGSGMFISADNGANWSAINSGLPLSGPNIFIYDILIEGSNMFIGTHNGVYLSTNDGTTWTAANGGLPAGQTSTTLAKNSTHLFTTMSGGFGMYVSTDNGTSWLPANTGLIPSSYTEMAVKGSDVYVCDQSNGIYKSTNNGATWTSSNTGMTGTNARSIEVIGSYLFAGTSNDMYISSNDGASWTSINDGMEGDGISAISYCSPYVLAGCEIMGGVWIRPLLDMATGINELSLENSGTVFPNPFSSAATLAIKNTIPVKNAELIISDVMGRKVKIIQNINSNQIAIEREMLPSGVYFYQLSEATKNITGKFIIE